MDILAKITANKKKELSILKDKISIKALEKSPYFTWVMPSFHDALKRNKPSVITEFKRKSPSKGMINEKAGIREVVKGYEEAGAAAISILTDHQFFGGDNSDLLTAAGTSQIPLLRKDFIIDEYQIVEAKSIGASAILLIASILDKKEVSRFSETASRLGLDVLFEIHNEAEIDKLCDGIRIIGVNNRNLNTFETNKDHSKDLFSLLPSEALKVAESGIKSAGDVLALFNTGYDAFLIGETFMRSEDPGKTAAEFIKNLSLEKAH